MSESESVEFATSLLNGSDLLQKQTDSALQGTSELSSFMKKLSKLEAKFGADLEALVNKDGRKILSSENFHG